MKRIILSLVFLLSLTLQTWGANATIYVDNVNGNNSNNGTSEVLAEADIPSAIGDISGGGNTIYVQNTGTPYTITSTIALTGSLKGDITNGRNRLYGYTTTPGADDGRPTITTATNSTILITLNDNDYWEFRHLKLTNGASTKASAFTTVTSASSPVWIKDCVIGTSGSGCLSLFNAATTMTYYLEGCEISYCTSSNNAVLASYVLFVNGCDIHDNAGPGILTQTGGSATTDLFVKNSIFDTNTGDGVSEVGTTVLNASFTGNTFVDNTSDGIQFAAKASATLSLWLDNNVFYNNTGEGINNDETQAETDATIRFNQSNAFGNNGSAAYTGLSAGIGEVTLTADPFMNRSGRDFAPNNTTGGGALLRRVGFVKAFSTTMTNKLDIGAVQHQDSIPNVLRGGTVQ